ncbi:MAG TPA: site-specific integrase [Syntrophomonas sp.]|nr:site-specific integrase [Syntrophomonas sp.]
MNDISLASDNGLEIIAGRVQEYIDKAKAENTLKAYRSDWADFAGWCGSHSLQPIPAFPETVAAYLADLAGRGYKAATIERRLISISKAHTSAGHDDVTKTALVKEVWAGIKRTIGTAQEGKAPAVTADIKAMVSALPDNLLGVRDQALLLVGFAGAFRRSELVNIDVEDLEFKREGIVVTLRHSKTDQEGKGRKVGIPYGSYCDTCPVRSLQTWLEQSGITSGPVFRSINRHGNLQEGRLSDKAVALIVKRCAEAAGLDASQYSGHSLRAGLATSAAMNGVSERAIMNQTGHHSQAMVRRYIREGSLFNDNAAAGVGL